MYRPKTDSDDRLVSLGDGVDASRAACVKVVGGGSPEMREFRLGSRTPWLRLAFGAALLAALSFAAGAPPSVAEATKSTPGGLSTSVSAGYWHSCGVYADGSVECWGWDYHGQSAAPDGTFASVSAGRYHTCGLKTDGAVVCWGSDSDGQPVSPGGSFVWVSAGGWHTCGVKTTGAVVCWGLGPLRAVGAAPGQLRLGQRG